MKKVIFGMILLVLISVFGSAVLGQKASGKPRDLFIEKERDETKGKSGVKFRILLKRGNQRERYVSPDENFYSGDKIKLAFDINFSGYIALLNVGSSGKINMLYPYVGADAAIEPSASEQLIPANSKDWITFDNRPGTEKITVVFSTNPLESIDDVIELSKKDLSVTVSKEGNSIYVTASAEAQSILSDLNSRSLTRSKSRDLFVETVNNEATYVVAEPGLISQPTAFIISLEHRGQN